MELLQPGKYNLMTAAGSTGGGGGSGGGGVPASIPENIIQDAAARTDGTNRTNRTNRTNGHTRKTDQVTRKIKHRLGYTAAA